MKILVVLLLQALAIQAFAQGQFRSGNQLKSECVSGRVADENFCMGYIAGVQDARGYEICSPVGRATLGQFVDIVKKYLNDNPADLHRDADVLVMVALKSAFPCPKK